MQKKHTKRKPQRGSHPTEARILTWSLSVDLKVLEMTWGHDGPMRGSPEPVVLFAAYLVAKTGAPRVKPLGRAIARFAADGPFPSSMQPSAPATITAKLRATNHDRVLVLAVALEEDSGSDVRRVHALFEESARLRFWESDAREPAPVAIGESLVLPTSLPPFATRVHLMCDEDDLRDSCGGDDWIGAHAVVVEPSRSEETFRAQFVSADGKNDWTAMLHVAVR